MKNKILSVLLCGCLFSASIANAQDDATTSSGGFRFGIRAGATVSSFSHAQPHTSEKLGFMAGAFAEYGFSEKFAVVAEPSYSQLGGQFVRFTDDSRFGDNSIFSNSVTSSKITSSYIDVPVMAKYYLPAIGDFKPNVSAGGTFAYLLSSYDTYDRTYHYNQTFFSVHGTSNVTGQYEPYQVGAIASVGGEVSLGGSKRLLLDIRYRYGLTPAKKSFSYIDLNAVQGDLYTNTFYFTVGFGF